ncbi:MULTISPECIES: phosphate-starvation-inducible protein PsiE [Leuconostoc gelidum group]|uniref:phosphate-starvation-inducible protein PsiE n=1 Tax=Leuconostoc gelidum group TaxID=3016637 RepID=UPI00027E6817|nr:MULTISPECIES: phosphate-starvation-inducible PsiE family protein [Leuconostoc gelidum group]MBR2277205.1 phosphate-starvation-inducible PsiE family protein [Leuconostoc sp.]AFS40611.1 phosphate-starvation-inducible E subfamily protein [Leuconostoc gelidum JB7]MBZ5943723.1 phosphate-starvation-inducible PsiE family protein [Leuconostoc gasicomitatum]MBZ5946743.1 phosphate-starvation-inducible PsiE family protein [Leuconostoc gasicomitatum]MBZ5950011.1 phosphate-starvation-inducible PsiE fami
MRHEWHQKVANCFEYVLNIVMICIGFVIFGFLLREIYNLAHLLITINDMRAHFNEITEATLAVFLFFEFMSLVREYFIKDAHISMESFLYIGVTALIRAILVYHDQTAKTLLLAISISLLVVALTIYRFFREKKIK